jgi:hypothetical protein
VRAGTLLAALAFAGCHFDGGLGTGLLCPTGECPPGQVCERGVCTLVGAQPDAADIGDAADTRDGADMADAAVAENLVENPGMEEGVEPWTAFNALLAVKAGGHSGQAELQVCDGSVGDFTVYQDVLKAPVEEIPEGQSYAASVWVRASGSAPTPTSMKLTIRESGGSAERADHDGPEVIGIGDPWMELQATGTVQESDRENLILIVWGLGGGDATCFAVDDAVLRVE